MNGIKLPFFAKVTFIGVFKVINVLFPYNCVFSFIASCSW